MILTSLRVYLFMRRTKMSKVYLTGAGPGDIELMTLKAARVIKEADIIIYDRLANPEILDMARKDVKLIYVGKEDG